MANPSLAMIPSGVKATKLYSVLPTDGTGDFTVSRALDTAIRVNSSGLIESVLANVPRLDYTGGISCPVLLIEPERVNYALYSEQFDNAIWTVTSVVVTANQANGADGTFTADNITYVGGLGNPHLKQIQQNATITGGTASKTFTVSFWVEGTGKFRIKNTHSGVLDNFSSDITATSTLTRYSFTVTNSASAGTGKQIPAIIGATDDSSFDLNIWGGEIKEGILSSYIPTTTVAVTRNADVITDGGDVNTFNSLEGVLYAEMSALSNDLTNRYISISDGTTNNRIVIGYGASSNTLITLVSTGGVIQVNSGTSIILTQTNTIKVAFKYKENDFSAWVNGVEVFTDNLGSMPSANTFNTIQFLNGDKSTIPFYGKVNQLQVFKTALTDTELTALTT